MKEDEGETRNIQAIEYEEGTQPTFTTNQFKSLDMWQHHLPAILKNGRTVHNEPQMPDDADEEAIEKAKKELLVADPYVDLLCSPGTD